MTSELAILVEGVIMGRVFEQTDRGGTLSFQYDPGWIELEDAFPLSVSMPLTDAPYRQRFIKTFLWNLLPENPAVLEAWEKKYHVSRNNPFGLLKHVGEDVPGALQLVQPGAPGAAVRYFYAASLSGQDPATLGDEGRAVLRDRFDQPGRLAKSGEALQAR